MKPAYYNEIEPHAVQWLRNLINAGEIPHGVVDDRSIVDVQPADLVGFGQCHFFAGLGGWPAAARLAGWPDGRELWTASLPCQPFSAAGKQRGLDDDRHLWPHFFKLLRARRPAVWMGEQVAAAIRLGWLDGVLDDLESIDYAGRPVVIPACAVNAPHVRHRIYLCAHAERNEQPREESCCWSDRRMGRIEQPVAWDRPLPDALARFRALGDGVPRCVEGTDAARNAIVPPLAAEVIGAWLDTVPEPA